MPSTKPDLLKFHFLAVQQYHWVRKTSRKTNKGHIGIETPRTRAEIRRQWMTDSRSLKLKHVFIVISSLSMFQRSRISYLQIAQPPTETCSCKWRMTRPRSSVSAMFDNPSIWFPESFCPFCTTLKVLSWWQLRQLHLPSASFSSPEPSCTPRKESFNRAQTNDCLEC